MKIGITFAYRESSKLINLITPQNIMNKIAKSLLAIAALGAASLANAALIPSSGSVTVENTPYDGGNGSFNIGGGEFEATVAGYGSFYTFCVEIKEAIVLPDTYDYSLSSSVDSQVDNISKGTAYLYEKFVKGGLYARTLDAAHDEAAGFLQAAIWMLEDEDFSSLSGLAIAKFFDVATNPFIGQVVSAFGTLADAKMDDDLGKVKVMNLTQGSAQFQDILVYVPDSGTTLALLGLALGGIAVARRRR